MNEEIRIRQATKIGYIECHPGCCFDGSFMTSQTRRGRLQGGGEICPTLTAGEPEIYYYEGIAET